jgi:DNA-binding SARP family transcriptional activator
MALTCGTLEAQEIGSAMQDDYEIRVLGPIEVLTPSGCLAVGGRHARALLGALVVGVGHAVPIDHLREVIWGQDPPESVDNTLQSNVSHLRRLLGPDAIVRVDGSYELTTEPANIDAVRFETLLAAAAASTDDLERRRYGREALGLWRGRPFGDLADDEAFELDSYRLEEMRLAAMEICLEADLALGNHELIVGELEAAVEEHPYRERLWFLLIEALEAGYRRVEALRACARLRGVLAEVGLQASDELVALERRILEGHAASGPATPRNET